MMRTICSKIIILLPLTVMTIIFYETHAIVFKLTNTKCESFNESWVVFTECRLRALQRNKTILNIKLRLLHPASVIHMHMQIQKKANGYKPWLFDVTIDGCQYMRKPNNPSIQLVMSMFKDFSTVNHTCPYTGEQELSGFYPKAERLKVPFPTGDYKVILTFILHKQPTFAINVFFNYVEDQF